MTSCMSDMYQICVDRVCRRELDRCKLAVVAACMDVYLRKENAQLIVQYDGLVKSYNDQRIRMACMQEDLDRAWDRIEELEELVRTIMDRNERLLEANARMEEQLLDQSDTESETDVSRPPVSRRLSF